MADIFPVESGALEEEKDAGKGASGIVRRWLMELKIASEEEEEWRDKGKEIYERYAAESKPKEGKTKFNILFSNTQILSSAIYNSTPSPEVRRRFRSEDPIGKNVSEVLQRALKIVQEDGGFDEAMEDANLDHLLPGRGVIRVRWLPEMETQKEKIPTQMDILQEMDGSQRPIAPEGAQIGEDGQPFFEGEDEQVKVFEEIQFEYVHWDSFRRGPGRRWRDVNWIAFEHLMTKEELDDQFGRGHGVKLDVEVKDAPSNEGDIPSTVWKKGRIWEIWDKSERKVLFIAPSVKDKVIHEEDDPLGLKDFFCTPRPLYSIKTDKLIPIPEFTEYEDQADELDLISHRIQRIIGGMKLRGVYDSSLGEFEQIFSEDDNAMIPSRDGGAAIQAGGMERAVWFMPVQSFGAVLAQLYQDRIVLRDTIFEVTGISDIIRGASRASETATAQNIKAKYGGMRLDKRVRAVAFYARDLLNIAAEVMAENFDPETLFAMTGVEITDDMVKLMRDDFLRGWRVDIETDSTISASEQGDQQEMTKLLMAVSQYIQGMAPLVMQGMFPMNAAKTILLGIIRKFKFGREVEDSLAMLGTQEQQQQDGQQGPSPEERAQQAEQQKVQAEMQMEQQKMQFDAQMKQQKMQMDQMNDQREQALEEQKAQLEIRIDKAESEAKIALEREKMEMEMELERDKMQLDADTKIKVARIQANAKEEEEEEEFAMSEEY
jgi:hypothetical protein